MYHGRHCALLCGTKWSTWSLYQVLHDSNRTWRPECDASWVSNKSSWGSLYFCVFCWPGYIIHYSHIKSERYWYIFSGTEPVLFEGKTEGTIVPARGPKVFGWDAVFEPLETGLTWAFPFFIGSRKPLTFILCLVTLKCRTTKKTNYRIDTRP